MKVLSFLTLSALLTISSCSHFKKSCCAPKSGEKMSCDKDGGKKACCKKAKKCADGSCTKDKKECVGDSCPKKS